jgi:hypothetical protein
MELVVAIVLFALAYGWELLVKYAYRIEEGHYLTPDPYVHIIPLILVMLGGAALLGFFFGW